MTKTEIKKAKKLAKLNAENVIRGAREINAETLKVVLAVSDRLFAVELIATEIASGKHVDESGQATLKAADPEIKSELAAALKALASESKDAKVSGRLSFIARDLLAKVTETAKPAKPVLLDDLVPSLLADSKFAEAAQLLCSRLVDDDVRAMLVTFGRENTEGGKALAEELRKLADEKGLKPGKAQFLGKLADTISPLPKPSPKLELVEQPKASSAGPKAAPKPPRDKEADKRRRAELFAAYKRGDVPAEFVELDGDKIIIRLNGRVETFKAASKAA